MVANVNFSPFTKNIRFVFPLKDQARTAGASCFIANRASSTGWRGALIYIIRENILHKYISRKRSKHLIQYLMIKTPYIILLYITTVQALGVIHDQNNLHNTFLI